MAALDMDGQKVSRLGLAFLAGAVIGILVSFTVNCTLVEISINAFFAVYFGILFLLIAGLILWRVKNGDHPRPCLLVCFSSLVLVSGLLCFILEKNWFVNMSPGLKVPLYSILGVAVCFALLFSIIDLINYCCGLCSNDQDSKPLVETEMQVYLVVAAAVIMGFIFGLVFGLLDVEDADMAHLKVALLREESICYPIGALLGGVASAINQYLREESDDYTYNTLDDDDLEDDDDDDDDF